MTPSTLWCTGILGSGKTVTTASLIERLIINEAGPTTAVCFYFCKHSDSASLNSRAILGSLARQMLSSAQSEVFDERTHFRLRPMLENSVIAYLRNFLPLNKEVQMYYLIIDGLDECAEQELKTLAFYLAFYFRSPLFAFSSPADQIRINGCHR